MYIPPESDLQNNDKVINQQPDNNRGESKLVNAWMAQKAGMKNIDKEAIARKVEEMTKGTNKAIHEKELEQKRNIQVQRMKQKIRQYHQDAQGKAIIQQAIQKRLSMIQMRRDLSRVWAHFDFDMFYIACELLEHPEDIDKPCAVGTPDSVLCTANYVARQYGVRSAIPTFIAMKLCPELVLYKPDFSKYKKYSKIMREIMKQYDQNYESMGLDEIYIDITRHVEGFNPSEIQRFIKSIRDQVYNQTGLTMSCGIGANKQLCKMASEENKPNGQYIIENNKQIILTYLKSKPIRSIPGIGPVSECYLKGLGIQTIKQVLERIDELSIALSENTVQSLMESGLGIDRNYHCQDRDPKSVSKSETFKATNSKSEWQNKIMMLSEQVARDLNEQGMLCLNVAVGYQTDMFQKKEKSRKLEHYTNQKSKILKIVRQLMGELNIKGKIRLLGIRCSQLIDENEFKQKSLLKFMTKRYEEKQVSMPTNHHEQNEEKHTTQKNCPFKKPNDQPSPMKEDVMIVQNSKNIACPICNKIIQTKGNNSVLNKHIDRCLQMMQAAENQERQQIVQEIFKENKTGLTGKGKKTPLREEKNEKKEKKGNPDVKGMKNFFGKKQ